MGWREAPPCRGAQPRGGAKRRRVETRSANVGRREGAQPWGGAKRRRVETRSVDVGRREAPASHRARTQGGAKREATRTEGRREDAGQREAPSRRDRECGLSAARSAFLARSAEKRKLP